jgi:hypothetical protein
LGLPAKGGQNGFVFSNLVPASKSIAGQPNSLIRQLSNPLSLPFCLLNPVFRILLFPIRCTLQLYATIRLVKYYTIIMLFRQQKRPRKEGFVLDPAQQSSVCSINSFPHVSGQHEVVYHN